MKSDLYAKASAFIISAFIFVIGAELLLAVHYINYYFAGIPVTAVLAWLGAVGLVWATFKMFKQALDVERRAAIDPDSV